MKNLFSILFIFVISASFLIQTQTKLVYMIELARHGAKYPQKNVSATIDPPSLKGQLTGVGMRQQYLLGTYLYHDYIQLMQLVSPKLNPRQVQIFASSYQRAIDSAYSQMYGLFPNMQGHTIPDGYPANQLNPPFDLTSKSLKKQEQYQAADYALNKGFQPPHVRVDDSIVNYCPNYGVFYSQRLKDISKNLATFQGQHQLQITKMVLLFNVSVLQGTVPAISDLYDNIMATINLGRELPVGFNDYDLKSLRFISDYYKLSLETGYFGQTLSTPLLRFITQRFNLVQGRKLQQKLTIFMAHAQNIIQMQAILNLTSADCLSQKWSNKTVTSLNCVNTPDFSSTLLFEVYQNDQTFSYDVKVKYNGEYAYLCEKKLTTCPIDQFLARIGKYVHDDYEKQCGVKSQLDKDSHFEQIQQQSQNIQITKQQNKDFHLIKSIF